MKQRIKKIQYKDSDRRRKEVLEGHCHCKECGRVMRNLGRASWSSDGGVKEFSICEQCNLLRIEFEYYKGVKWHKYL